MEYTYKAEQQYNFGEKNLERDSPRRQPLTIAFCTMHGAFE